MTLLEAKGISMHFGGVKAIDYVDLTVDEGQIMGIIGPNGSGKTTFFNVLTGLYKPTSGRFLFGGTDITNWPPHRIAQAGIGRTFQNIRVFKNTSVLENVLVGEHTKLQATFLGALFRSPAQKKDEEIARKKAMELLDFVKLSDKFNEFSANLAYGEQRRLEIARALASQPKLLLLDEPTAGMNPSEADQVIQLFHKIHELGITIILIEHNMQVMMGTAERIIAFDAGVKIAEGTPKEIQYNERVIQAYLGEEE
ncbi:MAG: ABC transporter ATP-binding protein [Chloroflexi bacterium]|nr:ABC transporter ATP-binding protein [Chloroflexota bacterium]